MTSDHAARGADRHTDVDESLIRSGRSFIVKKSGKSLRTHKRAHMQVFVEVNINMRDRTGQNRRFAIFAAGLVIQKNEVIHRQLIDEFWSVLVFLRHVEFHIDLKPLRILAGRACFLRITRNRG